LSLFSIDIVISYFPPHCFTHYYFSSLRHIWLNISSSLLYAISSFYWWHYACHFSFLFSLSMTCRFFFRGFFLLHYFDDYFRYLKIFWCWCRLFFFFFFTPSLITSTPDTCHFSLHFAFLFFSILFTIDIAILLLIFIWYLLLFSPPLLLTPIVSMMPPMLYAWFIFIYQYFITLFSRH